MTIRLALPAVLLLALSFLSHSAEVAVPGANLLVSIPDGYWLNMPKDAPNIILQYDSPADDASIQLIKGITGTTLAQVAAQYERQIRPVFATLQQQESREFQSEGRQMLYRRYQAAGNGMTLVIQAVIFPAENERLVLHAISQPSLRSLMETVLTGIHAPITGADYTPGARVLLPETKYAVSPPAGWQVKEDTANNRLDITPPDGNGLLNVSYVKLDKITVTPAQLLEATLKEMEKALPKEWGVITFEDRLLPPAGSISRARRYQGIVNTVMMDLVMAARYQDNYLFTFFGNAPTARREQAWPLLTGAIESLAKAGDLPAIAPPPGGEALPAAWEIAGAGPPGWKLAATQTLAAFQGAGAEGADKVRINIKQYDRTGVHSDLNASAEEALRQLRAAPTARLLRREDAIVAGVPARVIEFTYEIDGEPQRMLQVLLATGKYVYWAGYSGPLTAYHAQLPMFQTMIKELSLKAATVAGQPPAAPASAAQLIKPAGMGIQFELSAGWQGATQNGIQLYTAAENSTMKGSTITVRRIPRTQAGYADARTAGNTLRAAMPRTATILTMTGGQVRGITYDLNDYRVSMDDAVYQHRRVYFFEFAGALVELVCQVEATDIQARDRVYTEAKPVFDRVFDTFSPAG